MNAHIAKPVDVSVLLETHQVFMTLQIDAPRLFYGILTSIDDQKLKTNNMHEKGVP